MFIATFQQVSSDKFKADKNGAGEMPFIGKLVAGKAKATIISGTFFKHNKYIPQRLYVCQNITTTLEDGRVVQNVDIISEISVVDLAPMVAQLGAPMLNLVTVAEEATEVGAEA